MKRLEVRIKEIDKKNKGRVSERDRGEGAKRRKKSRKKGVI